MVIGEAVQHLAQQGQTRGPVAVHGGARNPGDVDADGRQPARQLEGQRVGVGEAEAAGVVDQTGVDVGRHVQREFERLAIRPRFPAQGGDDLVDKGAGGTAARLEPAGLGAFAPANQVVVDAHAVLDAGQDVLQRPGAVDAVAVHQHQGVGGLVGQKLGGLVAGHDAVVAGQIRQTQRGILIPHHAHLAAQGLQPHGKGQRGADGVGVGVEVRHHPGPSGGA